MQVGNWKCREVVTFVMKNDDRLDITRRFTLKNLAMFFGLRTTNDDGVWMGDPSTLSVVFHKSGFKYQKTRSKNVDDHIRRNLKFKYKGTVKLFDKASIEQIAFDCDISESSVPIIYRTRVKG